MKGRSANGAAFFVSGAGGTGGGMATKAGATKAGGRTVVGRQRIGERSVPQKRAARADGWDPATTLAFMDALIDTCNASEAARAVGRSRAGAYRRRAADPAFREAWDAAIEMGYAEIELMLMRAALHGVESEEVTTDGEGVVKARKVKRAPNLSVALRLFLAYRDEVAAIRARRDQEGGARPDSPDAQARVEAMMKAIAERRSATGT